MNILGLSFYYHDSSAALVQDGRLVAAAEEERFSRLKHDSGFPGLAVEFVLKKAGITIHDVDYVVFYEKPFVKFERLLISAMATFPRSAAVFRESMQRWISDKLWIKSHMASRLKVPGSTILFCDHHMSHAASSFFTSPFEEAAILTVDGAGEWSTATMGVGRGNKIEILKELRFPHSLGLLYSAFTAYCGFEINEGEYKLMGMHPYGKPRHVDKIYELIRVGEDGSLWHDMRYFAYHFSRDTTLAEAFGRHFGRPPRDPKLGDKSLDPFYCDMAASIQVVTEEILLKMIQYLHRETGVSNLCLAGGVALNSVANYKLLRRGPFDDVYIHPAPGDDGGAVGAAYWAYNHLLGRPRGPALEHAYLGSEYRDEEIRAFLERYSIPYEKIEDDEAFFDFVAQRLAEGNVCGWFRGRFEWGPRALGSRSIIADPRKAEMKEKLNAKIKFREAFRPFAPSVLEERADEFFDFPEPQRHFPGRFMLYVTPVREDKRSVLPAITHEDGSGRLQTVYKETNPAYHRMIERFGEITGVPVVMNTSFNLKGEPIVEDPSHAFNTFSLSGMDFLFLNNFVVRADAKKKIAETRFALRHEGDSVTEMVSLTIAVLLFEGGLRLLPQFRPQESINQFDSKLGWQKTPGKVAKRVTPELEVTFRINEFGLRDDPMRSSAKPEGVFRVEMLGDSFVLGFTVDRQNLFVDQLEHWWNAEGRNVDVLNAGTEGWSTDQEALWFLEHGVDFDPDLVCIFPYENDIYWAGQTDYYGKAKPRFTPEGRLETGTLADTSPPKPPLQDWAIGQFIAKTLLPLLPRRGGCGPHEFELEPGDCVAREFGPLLTPAPPFVQDCVQHLRGALVALRDRCEELGVPLVMVPIPSESSVHPERREAFLRLAGLEGLSDEEWSPDAPVDLFLSLGEELGIRTYDPRPALRQRTQEIGRPLYFDQEWHFNPEGNHAFALALHNALDDLDVFPTEHAPRRAVSLAVPESGASLPRWPFVFLALWLVLGTAYAWTYRDEKPPRVFLEVGALLAVVFALFLGVGRLVESLPPRYAAWVLPGLVLVLLGVIGWKLGRRIGTILELLKAFTLRGHWYLMPLVVVLLTIGSLLVVAASSPLIAPFIYTLF